MGGRGETLRASDRMEQSNLEQSKQTKEGEVIHIVGMPPMYSWEFSPQRLDSQMGNIQAAEVTMSKYTAPQCSSRSKLMASSQGLSKLRMDLRQAAPWTMMGKSVYAAYLIG